MRRSDVAGEPGAALAVDVGDAPRDADEVFGLEGVREWTADRCQGVVLAVFMAVLVYIRHVDNIRRLLKGEEPKIGGKKDKPAA